MINKYETHLSRLEGSPCWGFLVGPGGVTFEIGKEIQQEGTTRGDYTIWIRTRFRIVVDKKLVLHADFPTKDHLPVLEDLLQNKSITKVAIDPLDNSLRMLINENCLLSAFPGPANSDMPWILFRNAPDSHGYLVVNKDSFEGPFA
jgi:hypothetical protein